MKIFKKNETVELTKGEMRELKEKAEKYDEMMEALSDCVDITGYDEYRRWWEFFRMFDGPEVTKIRAMNMVALTKTPSEDNSKYKEKYDTLQQAIRDAHRDIIFFKTYDIHLRHTDPDMTFSERSVKAMSETIKTNEKEIQNLLGKYNDAVDKKQQLQEEVNRLDAVYKPDEDAGALLGTIHALRSTINHLNLEIDAMKHMLDRLDEEQQL